jgi:hypothetical protein
VHFKPIKIINSINIKKEKKIPKAVSSNLMHLKNIKRKNGDREIRTPDLGFSQLDKAEILKM